MSQFDQHKPDYDKQSLINFHTNYGIIMDNYTLGRLRMIDSVGLNRLSKSFENRYPQDILKWAVDILGDELAIVTSFQPTGIVTLHMLSEFAPEIPVLTLDTGLLFPETYDLIEQVERRFNLNLIRVRPELSVVEQDENYGEALWERHPDHCCQMRKVEPLNRALDNYSAWVTGIRRDQSPTRAKTAILSKDKKSKRIRIAPFATWTESMIWTYIRAHNLPYNVLHDQGYPSIGCAPCTLPVQDGDNMRNGRWSQQAKSECGIHLAYFESSEENTHK